MARGGQGAPGHGCLCRRGVHLALRGCLSHFTDLRSALVGRADCAAAPSAPRGPRHLHHVLHHRLENVAADPVEGGAACGHAAEGPCVCGVGPSPGTQNGPSESPSGTENVPMESPECSVLRTLAGTSCVPLRVLIRSTASRWPENGPMWVLQMDPRGYEICTHCDVSADSTHSGTSDGL